MPARAACRCSAPTLPTSSSTRPMADPTLSRPMRGSASMDAGASCCGRRLSPTTMGLSRWWLRRLILAQAERGSAAGNLA
ncbi:hypothetical protein ACQJBY_042507 [Aegilops geniculata]